MIQQANTDSGWFDSDGEIDNDSDSENDSDSKSFKHVGDSNMNI